MSNKLKQIKDKTAEKIRDKGNPNLANTVENSDVLKLTNEEFISGLKSAYPNFKTELKSLQQGIKALEEASTTTEHKQFYDDENNTWMLRKIADEIEAREAFKYVSSDDTDQLYVYQDGIWVERGESKIRQHCMDITNELLRQRDIKQVDRIIKTRNEVYNDEFEYPKTLIPFENGVYDLEEDEFRDFSKSDNLKFKFNVEYLEDPENTKVDEFLRTIQDTEEKITKLKEAAGLAMLPDHPVDKAVVAYGQGSNGKNMFVKIIQKIVGDAGHKLDSKQLTGDKFAAGELEDKTFVFFDEFGKINDPDKLKTVIGDDTMRVRPFNGQGYITDQRAFPIFAANELPVAPEQNPGFFRRWEVIDFPFRFTSDPNDSHKEKIPQNKLEDEYMSKQALSAFASRCVEHLKNVLEDESFTHQHSTKETKLLWNNKSSPVYSFINNFVVQGKIPNQGNTEKADHIAKDKLLELVNDYAEMLNSTKIRQHELTAALEGSPDIKLGNDGRIERQDGSEKRAYTGIKLAITSFHDTQGSDDLYRFTNTHLNAFADCENIQSAQMLVIVESELESQALRYLNRCDDNSSSLITMIRELKLHESDIHKILSSDFTIVESKESEEFTVPEIAFDEEAFNKAVKESDKLTGELQNLKKPLEWLEEQTQGWSQETHKKIEDVVQQAVKQGFGEHAIEEVINQKLEEGELHQPAPSEIKKL